MRNVQTLGYTHVISEPLEAQLHHPHTGPSLPMDLKMWMKGCLLHSVTQSSARATGASQCPTATTLLRLFCSPQKPLAE